MSGAHLAVILGVPAVLAVLAIGLALLLQPPPAPPPWTLTIPLRLDASQAIQELNRVSDSFRRLVPSVLLTGVSVIGFRNTLDLTRQVQEAAARGYETWECAAGHLCFYQTGQTVASHGCRASLGLGLQCDAPLTRKV